MSHNDWIPTLCTAAGEPDIIENCKKGYKANGITYKVHLDGHDQFEFLTQRRRSCGQQQWGEKRAHKFFYSDDDGLLVGMRQGRLQVRLSEQRRSGTMGLWAEPFTTLRLQKIFNLFQDPFERADITSNTYWDWNVNHVGSAYGMMDEVFKFEATFKDLPAALIPAELQPRQRDENYAGWHKAAGGFQGEPRPW